MHASSYEHMQILVDKYLDSNQKLLVADIGSYDVNGSYRTLFGRPAWQYLGIDLNAGPGVDIVLTSPYKIPLRADAVDLVISGQAFEHVEYFWQTWLEMLRIAKSGALVFLIAPSRGPEHKYPQDCWRFYPDGFRALAKLGGCEVLDVHTDWEPHSDPGSSHWGDTVGVFRKNRVSIRERVAQSAMRLAFNFHPVSKYQPAIELLD